MKEHLIEIGYKSGNKIKVWATEYSVAKDSSGIESIQITHISNVKILYYGISNIEYIVKLKTRRSYFWGLFKF